MVFVNLLGIQALAYMRGMVLNINSCTTKTHTSNIRSRLPVCKGYAMLSNTHFG